MRALAAAVAAALAGVVLFAHPFGHGDRKGNLSALAQPRSPYSQEPVVIDVYEYGFSPGKLVIRAGQTVAWKDVGKQFHVVTPDTRAGRGVWMAAEDFGSSSHLFKKPGRYPYHCALHPQMRGVIVVSKSPSRASS